MSDNSAAATPYGVVAVSAFTENNGHRADHGPHCRYPGECPDVLSCPVLGRAGDVVDEGVKNVTDPLTYGFVANQIAAPKELRTDDLFRKPKPVEPEKPKPTGTCGLPDCSKPVMKHRSGKPPKYCSKEHASAATSRRHRNKQRAEANPIAGKLRRAELEVARLEAKRDGLLSPLHHRGISLDALSCTCCSPPFSELPVGRPNPLSDDEVERLEWARATVANGGWPPQVENYVPPAPQVGDGDVCTACGARWSKMSVNSCWVCHRKGTRKPEYVDKPSRTEA